MQKGGTWWVNEGQKSQQFKSLPDTHHWRKNHPITPKEYSYFQKITACIWLLEEICTHQKAFHHLLWPVFTFSHGGCGKVLSALFMWREKRNGSVVYWWSIDSQEGENQHKKPKKVPKESSLIQDYHVCQLYYLNFTRIDMLTFCTERSIKQLKGKKMIELLNNKIQNKKHKTNQYSTLYKHI